MKLRIIALFAALALLLGALAGCATAPADTTTPVKPHRTTPADSAPSYEDFGGEELRVSVSANQDSETTFPAQDRYLIGPDALGEDPVQNLVFRRNRAIARDLNLTVRYETTDLSVGEVHKDVEAKVLSSAQDVPDVYINDARGLSFAMVSGYLRNLLVPGEGERSYFDFTQSYWYTEYMEGATLDPSKQYLAAGDCFLDLIRFAWVFYVNLDLFDETFGTTGYDSHALYQNILEGSWDYDQLRYLCEQAFRDSGNMGETERTDPQLGLAVPHLFSWVCCWSSGTDVIDLSGATPQVIENNVGMNRLCDKFRELYQTAGVCHVTGNPDVLEATLLFLDNTSLFALSVMGEMESETVRSAPFRKGLTPLPKFDRDYQEQYHTAVHNQAEVASLLNTTDHFTAASAYLQALCASSTEILHEYYENTLKYKYNDDKETKAIIDLVHDSVDSPFSVLISRLVYARTSSKTLLWDLLTRAAENQTNSFQSDYASYYPELKSALEKLSSEFAALE